MTVLPVPTSFRVKICGVRKLSDVRAAAAAGADAVGLNFYPLSVRFLPSDSGTAEIAALALQLGLKSVGVFVNEDPRSVLSLANSLRLSAVQLHGEETVANAQSILDRSVSVIRAVRLPTSTLTAAEIDRHVRPWREAGCGILLDADAGGSFGGVGHRLDWEAMGRWAEKIPYPWMLAGGLTPEGVADAITLARPFGVDVASGVEDPRGTKSAALVDAFCRNALGLLEEGQK